MCDSPETGMASGSHTAFDDPRSIGSKVGLAPNPVCPPCTSVRHFCCLSPFWRFLKSVTSELLTYPQKGFQYNTFSGGGANLKLSAFCVCDDRFMIWDCAKPERETSRFFLLLISPELQLAWFFAFPGCELKTVRFFNQ